MNTLLLAELGRQRRRELRREFKRGDTLVHLSRPVIARALRAAGDRLFRLGVSLDDRVIPASVADTRWS